MPQNKCNLNARRLTKDVDFVNGYEINFVLTKNCNIWAILLLYRDFNLKSKLRVDNIHT